MHPNVTAQHILRDLVRRQHIQGPRERSGHCSCPRYPFSRERSHQLGEYRSDPFPTLSLPSVF